MEIWKDIPNYEGYQVSDLGRIRTHNKTTFTEKHGVRHWKDRILKQKKSTNKYGRQDYRVELWSKGNHKTMLVARLVAFTFFEENIKNKDITVNHINGNSLDNRLTNLELVNLKENIQHAFRTGLYNSVIKKIKITDKITGTIIYPSSLNDGNKYIGENHDYLSKNIKRNVFENEKYKWELI